MNQILKDNSFHEQYRQKVYAGVLGKIIGVYLGRPVEGWPYEDIQNRFGEVDNFVNGRLSVPLIVADDDISGTFGFFRAIEDNEYKSRISSEDIGNTWLNYIIEEKTILWWGGLGRSTEHTAYLRLKNGIKAPQSGSAEMNGKVLSEQIGAQIFIDAFAMICPGDPEESVYYVREAASVSHDGLAVAAACFLGALEALAFTEKRLDPLLDAGLGFVKNPVLRKIVDQVRTICSGNPHWRDVRSAIDEKYGYDRFKGVCPIETNHAAVLAALILGGNDFHKSIMIASSAGWDTDCNAGNVGCLNGIRLGLDAITQRVDLRTPVADRMLIVTSDSGSCITDAVQQAQNIVFAAHRINGIETNTLPTKKFTFEFPGSLQGFSSCAYSDYSSNHRISLTNQADDGIRGLKIILENCSGIEPCDISTPTQIDQSEMSGNFATFASPTLYSGQLVNAEFVGYDDSFQVQPYVLIYDVDDKVRQMLGTSVSLIPGETSVSFLVPDTHGMPIFRLGFRFASDINAKGTLVLKSIDWNGAPIQFCQTGTLMKSIWDTNPNWMKSWSSSAKHFAPDFKYTYCISHPEEQGVVTQGTRDWLDYSVESDLIFNYHEKAGLVIRSIGHRRYYAALFRNSDEVKIVCRQDNDEQILATTTYQYEQDLEYRLKFIAAGNTLSLIVQGVEILSIEDETYTSGAAGFRVDRGTVLASGFLIRGY